MGFQLNNPEGTGSPSETNDDTRDNMAYMEDNNAKFIADQYQNTEDTPIQSATILTQTNTFSPVLFYIGIAIFTASIIYALVTITNGNYGNPMWFTTSKIVSVANLFWIADAIIMVYKKCDSASLILWAWLFPFVYWIKRFRANGDKQIIPLIIIGIEVILVILCVGNAGKIQEAKKATVGSAMLEFYSVKIGINRYPYSQLIENNVTDPVYRYKSATASDPEYLILKGNTMVRGYEENIEMRWNYASMNLMSITLGKDTYTGDNLDEPLLLLTKNTPPENSDSLWFAP